MTIRLLVTFKKEEMPKEKKSSTSKDEVRDKRIGKKAQEIRND